MTARLFTPREYQLLATEFLQSRERCALWAGCGLGKTSSTLLALDGLYLTGETHPTLVIAPKRVAEDVWRDEAAKWSNFHHIEVQPIIGAERYRRGALCNTNASVFTINYENLPWLIETVGVKWPWRTVVSDESTKLKGFRGSFRTSPKGKVYYVGRGGQRARALGSIAHTNRIRRFIELTGTPSPNGLVDLWGQSWFLDAGQRLGRTFDAFQQRWFSVGYDGFNLIPHPFAQEEVQERLRDVCLSIDPRDWFDLKEPIVNVVRVKLPSKARGLYQQMEREMFVELDGHEVEAVNAAARTIKCLQICNGFAFTDEVATAYKDLHDAKLQALDEIVEEAAGAPVFVAYHFRPDLARIKKAFPDALDLSKPDELRDAKAGKGRIWLGHPDSVGHGVDGLQDHCNIGVFYSQWWDLEKHDQWVERIGPVRQMQAGHDRPVFLHYLVAENTVDELVIARRETKRSVQDLLLDYMKGKRT